MTALQGPGSSYELLFNRAKESSPSLPEDARRIYPGDWHIPTIDGRPYIYSNFAMSRDGRISYNVPGQEAAYYVTKGVPHDRWLMGLLRMRADAVMIGDNSIRLEPDFQSSAQFIYPADGDWYTAQRRAAGRSPLPLLVILSYTGQLPAEAACLQTPDQEILLATTTAGAEQARAIQSAGALEIVDLGAKTADLHQLVALLYERCAVRTLLCEGGARVFAGMLDAGLIDEEFVTWCPAFVGRDPENFRPGYSEGVAWTPATAPYSEPISLHQAGDYLYMRTRCRYPDHIL